jgi:hypothetical protein
MNILYTLIQVGYTKETNRKEQELMKYLSSSSGTMSTKVWTAWETRGTTPEGTGNVSELRSVSRSLPIPQCYYGTILFYFLIIFQRLRVSAECWCYRCSTVARTDPC